MAGHGVPVAAGGELSHAHAKLAALHDGRMDVLVDHALVARLGCTQGALVGLVDVDLDGGIGLVRRAGVDVELGRIGGIEALKAEGLGAHAHVQAVILLEIIHGAVHGDGALAADVDDAHLAALQEGIGSQLLAADELNGLVHRHHAAGDDAVEVRIGEDGIVRCEHGFNEIFAAQALGGIVLGVLGSGGLANGELHGNDLLISG